MDLKSNIKNNEFVWYEYESIPKEFFKEDNPYNAFLTTWFFSGVMSNGKNLEKFTLSPEFEELNGKCLNYLSRQLNERTYPNGESIDHNYKIANTSYVMSMLFDYNESIA